MTSSNGNIVRVTGHLCGEFTGPRGVLMCSLMRAWINGWVNNREAVDVSRHRAHYDVTVMKTHEFRLLDNTNIYVMVSNNGGFGK